MGRLILDDELRKKLQVGRSPFEVCDEAGNVVGHYLPEQELNRRLAYAAAKACFRDEDIAAARKEMMESDFRGLSTDDILASLAEVRRQWEAKRQ